MLHSKATAALMRLKEIDKKYKMRNEERYTINSSTESTLSSPSMEYHSAGDHKKLNSLEVPLRSKLDVRMPKTYIEEEEEEEEEGEEEEGGGGGEEEEEEEEERDEEDKSHSTTKEKVSSTIVINIETKSSENVKEEFSNNVLSSVIETDEKTSEKFEEKEISENNGKENVEIEKKNATSSEMVVKMKKEEAEIIVKVSNINTGTNTSNISSEIEELESPLDEHPVSYINDTFEEVLSTTLSTTKSRDDMQHMEESLKMEEEEKMEDGVKSGVKQIDILLNKGSTVEQQEEKSNEKQIVELVPPKLMENTSECDIDLDKELSNYVKTIENIDEDVSDITPVCLLRHTKQPETFLKTRKKYKHRPIVKDLSQSDKTITESLTTSKNNRRSVEHSSFTPISGTKKMEKVHEENRSMHEKTSSKQNEQWRIREKKNKLRDERNDSMMNKNPLTSCNNDRPWVTKNLLTQNKTKKRKSKTRTLYKPNKTTDFNKDKFLRFDMKQIHCLRKQISKLAAEIHLDNGSSSKKLDRILFKPLDFPNIASYTSPDMDTFKLAKENPYVGLHERLAVIRQWLKDQYIFYQVRSNLVEKINEKYVPMSLENAKTVIRELQKVTVEAR